MQLKSDGSNFIIIGGAPRSGTTIVQNVLDCHRRITGLPEFQHFPDIVQMRRRLLLSNALKLTEYFYGPEQVDTVLKDTVNRLLLDHCQPSEGADLVCEKTPQNVEVFTDLGALYPKAKFIWVLRDPRAVVNSMLKGGVKAKKIGQPVYNWMAKASEATAYLERNLIAGKQALETLGDRILCVGYEKLLEDPELVSKDICRFLEIEWDEAMMHPGQHPHLGEESMTTEANAMWYSKESFKRDFDTSALLSWQKSLSPKYQVLISNRFRNDPLLKKHGYDFSNKNLSTGRCAFAVLSLTLTKLLRVPFRILRKLGSLGA